MQGSWRTLRAAPAIFLGLPLLVIVGLVIPAVAIVSVAVGLSAGAPKWQPILGLPAVVLVIVGGYLLLRLTGALAMAAYRVALGERPTTQAVWREGAPIAVKKLGLLILLGVIYVAVFVALMITVALLAFSKHRGGEAAAIVLVLAIVPGLYWLAVRLVYVVPVIGVEPVRAVDSLRRSLALTKGRWWPTFGRLLVMVVLMAPVLMLVSWVTAPMHLPAGSGPDRLAGTARRRSRSRVARRAGNPALSRPDRPTLTPRGQARSSRERSTWISSARRSSSSRRAPRSAPVGTRAETWASKSRPPAIGASRVSVANSSRLMPCRASTPETAATMPGRSVPSKLSRKWPPSSAVSAALPSSTRRSISPAATGSRAARKASTLPLGIVTTTMPANLPANSATWLRSQLPPLAETTSASELTSPARSSPRIEITSVCTRRS